MKIFIQNNNYTADLGFYMVPDTALNQVGRPLFLPDFAHECLAMPHAVIRISRLGKHISERFAHRYYQQMSVGITFKAIDFFTELRQKNFPTEPSTGFDGAVNIGQWITLPDEKFLSSSIIHFYQNDKSFCSFTTADMLTTAEQQIAYLSQYYKLCQGDLIFMGSPSKIKTNINDCFKATINEKEILYFNVK